MKNAVFSDQINYFKNNSVFQHRFGIEMHNLIDSDRTHYEELSIILKMKNYYLPILCLMLLLSACRDGEILESEVTIDEEAMELEGAFYSGIVSWQGLAIADAEITLYQNGEELGQIYTDQDGKYDTFGFDLEVGPEVTFVIEEESFIPKVKRSNSHEGVYQNFDLKIYKGLSAGLKGIGAPGDTSLVKIYGTITDKFGDPVVGARCYTFWNIEEVVAGMSYSFDGGIERTDESGYFEMLVEPNTKVTFKAWATATDCQEVLNVPGEEEPEFNIWIMEDAQVLNIGTESFEIIERSDIEIDFFLSSVVGQYLDCKGDPVVDGEIQMVADYNLGGGIIGGITYIVTPDERGYFIQEMNYCALDEDLTVILSMNDGEGFEYAEALIMQDGPNIVGRINACEENATSFGSISIEVGDRIIDDYKVFDVSHASTVGLAYAGVPVFFVGQATIELPEVNIGDNTFSKFKMSPDHSWGFNAKNGELKAVVESIENGIATGTIEGQVQTTGDGIQAVTGSFTFNI